MAIDFGLWTNLSTIDRKFDQLARIEDGFGIDIETGYNGPAREKFGLHPETAFVAGFSVSGDPGWARYIPLSHARTNNVDNREFAQLLAPMLASGKAIAHNSLFELRHLSQFLRMWLTTEELTEAGLPLSGRFPLFSDSMIEAYLLAQFREYGLKKLAWEVFRHPMVEIHELFPQLTSKQQKSLRFSDLELSAPVVSYACEDAAWCLALSRKHRPLVSDRLLYKTEMALISILAEMEDCGVAFDWVRMEQARQRAEEFSEAQRREIMFALSERLDRPVDINLGSTAQVADVLYGQLNLKTTRLTQSGQMSTDEKALAGLAKKHSVVRRILEWREVRKLIGSYLEKYQRDFNYAPDGRTHPNHNQVRVVSGRFSVTEPAYQQQPKRYDYELESGAEFHLNFRDFIKAGPDHFLIGFDYSQIELRVLAALSGEPALVKAYQDGDDVHALTASLLFDVPLPEVTKEYRAVGKTFNFATVYGQGVKALAESMGVTLEVAQQRQDRFFGIYSSVKSWKERQIQRGVQQGYTTSVFGRRHPIWELESESGAVRSTGERLCVNAPIQGNAADICKVAMVRSDNALARAGLKDRVHLIMNIHDALVYEVHNSVSPQTVIDVVDPQVTFPIPDWPPIEVEWEIGLRWGSMVDLELDHHRQIVVPDRSAEPAPAAA